MTTAEKPEAVAELSPDKAIQKAVSSSKQEPFMGNVSKYTPVPSEGEEGVRKGLLQFDACFEEGWLPVATRALLPQDFSLM